MMNGAATRLTRASSEAEGLVEMMMSVMAFLQLTRMTSITMRRRVGGHYRVFPANPAGFSLSPVVR
jgi:hypothetical protein